LAKKASTSKKSASRKTGASGRAGAKKATARAGKKTGSGEAKPAKKAAARKAAGQKTAKKSTGPAKSSRKVAKKKAGAKASKQTTKKATGKATSKAAPSKKAGKKKATKAASKKSASKGAGGKAAPKKDVAKKPEPKKASGKSAPKSKAGESKAGGPKGSGGRAPAPDADGKGGRKGITIVTKKPVRRPQPPKGRPSVPALTGSILGMGLGSGRPLIPSGGARPASASGGEGEGQTKAKSPFTKRQLDRYREILLQKRRELLGDIDSMENEALKSESGSLSHLPQHMAEHGSEMYDQSLSLDLAAADRTLLREIDAALDRIAEKTYGVCEMTGKPISKERLAELPWARYSIEAAREMERRGR
jgi:DnaK suppressor protein